MPPRARRTRPARVRAGAPKDAQALASVADRFYLWAQERLGKRALLDVFAWEQDGEPRLAFHGTPRALTLAFRLGSDAKGDNLASKYPFNRRFSSYRGQRSEGAEEGIMDELFGLPRGTGGHNGYWGQDEPFPYDILAGFGKYADKALEGFERGNSDASVTLIPTPGHPYYGKVTVYYSARHKRWITPRRPAWVALEPQLVRDHSSGGEVYRPTVRWCVLAPTVKCSRASGSAVLTDPNGAPILFTHSFHLNVYGARDAELDESTARAMRDCGGLMFPSLAVAQIPAPNFLPGVMVVEPSVIVNALAKHRIGETPLARLYDADVWTATVRGMETEHGPTAYAELAGQLQSDDFMDTYHNHFWSSGLPSYQDAGGFRPEGAKELRSLAALSRTVGRYSKRWGRRLASNAAAFRRELMKARGSGVNDSGNSAFLEAKISGILAFSCVRLVLIPDYDAPRYRRYLHATGYRGPILEVPTTFDEARAIEGPGHTDDGDFTRYAYAWRAADLAVESLTRPVKARAARW